MMGMVIIDSIYKYVSDKIKAFRKGNRAIISEEITNNTN
jgi:hypothetical protein